MRILLASVIACLGWVNSGLAQEDARVARVQAAFAGWLDTVGGKGVVALRRGSRDIAVLEQGITADTFVELASVSKAITGVCASELVRNGTLSWSDTVSGRVGRGPDVRLDQLVTQTSGLREDSTQKLMQRNYGKTVRHRSADVLDAVIARGGPGRKAGKFRYNNENFALASLIIEAATDRPYREVCAELVFEPLGLQAQVSRMASVSLPWGGWRMRVADYARWHGHWFGANQPTGRDPRGAPHADAGHGVSYGMGTFFRASRRGNSFWHFGALCFPGSRDAGAFAVTWFADWTLVAAYDACVIDFDDMIALDNAMVSAVLGPLE